MSKDTLKEAIAGAKEIKKKGDGVLTKQEAISQGLRLVEKLNFCMLGTNSGDGFPNIKAMLNLKHNGLKRSGSAPILHPGECSS